MRQLVTEARLQVLWEAAMEGSLATRDDVLDLIDEIRRLRQQAPQQGPQEFSILRTPNSPLPWDDTFPGNH